MMTKLYMGFVEDGPGPWYIRDIDLNTFVKKEGWEYKLIEVDDFLAVLQYTPEPK